MLTPSITFILATRNRCATTLETLGRLAECGLHRCAYEVYVVDNASSDGTPDAVAREFPEVNLVRLKRNHGSVAKNHALRQSAGKYVVFLDDDSYPLHGSVQRMIRYFQHNPRLGAASFNVRLPSGRRECSAYPNVFIGCGVGLRRTAIEQVGPLPDDFFMQAEEYDLSLRLLEEGWDVRTFDDLHVLHAKSPATRSSAQKMMLDVRNNLLLVLRRFPATFRQPFLHEWLARYWAIASAAGRRLPAARGFLAGAARHLTTQRHQPLSDGAFEKFARVEQTCNRLLAAKQHFGLRRVLLIDWGKNMLAFRMACESAGVKIVAVADEKLAGQRYRDIPVLDDRAALGEGFDGAIIANLSPVHAAERAREWRSRTPLPVIDLFEDERAAVQVAAA